MAEKISYEREAARRVFAAEFRNTKLTKKFDTDDKAPTFAITPTGACANRVLIVGVLTSRDKVGEAGSFRYRGIVNDNTGDFYLSIGSYQPEAMHQIAAIIAPQFVAVVGKPSVYKNDKGNIYTSIKVEEIHEVDAATRNIWVLDTAKATLDRIAKLESTVDDIWVDEIKAYYNPNLSKYKAIVKKALDSLKV